MAVHFRPFEPHRDYPLAAELVSRDPLDAKRSSRELEALESRIPRSCHMKSWVAEEGGRAVGLASTFRSVWDLRRGGMLLRLHLEPGASLSTLRQTTSFLMRQAKRGRASFVTVWTRDESIRRVSYLQDLGFHLVKRHAVTRLKLADFFPEPYLPRFVVLEKKGVEFLSGSDLAARGMDGHAVLQDAVSRIMREEYGFDGYTKPPFEKFHRRAFSPLAEDPDTTFVALHKGFAIGFTRLHPSEAEPGLLRTGLTGVVPSWRNRKVGTCLKTLSLIKAKERGAEFIQTDNAEDNPMLHLNLKLGFHRVATLMELEMVMPRTLPREMLDPEGA